MHNTTLNKLQMRKDNQYPESKGNYPNEKEIWDEYMDKVDNIKF